MKERRMDRETFNRLLDEMDGNSLQTLKEKNARYSSNDDALHNFRSGAEIAGRTPAQTCWGYATKHFIALRDMVERNDFSNREDFLEKCQDSINYIRFLWCIGNDEEYWKKQNETTSEKIIKGKIGSPEDMFMEVSVFNKTTGELIRFYGIECEAVVDELRDGFIVAYIDENRNEAVEAYRYDDYTYKINERKDK